MLLTVDLEPYGGSFYLTASTTQANQYNISFDFKVKNIGSTTANLTGNLGNFTDNVHLRAVLSTDQIYGNGDDTEVGVTFFSGPLTDNQNITLAPDEYKSVHMGGTITASPAYKYLLAKVDSTNVLAESDETNNANFSDEAKSFDYLKIAPTTNFQAGTTKQLTPDAFLSDISETDFSNSKLTVKMTQGISSEQLAVGSSSFQGETLKQAGSHIKLGKTTVATAVGGKHGVPLTVQFQQNADTLLIDQVLKNITFKSKKSDPGGLREVAATLDTPGKQLTNGGQYFNVTANPHHH